jgi:hypothetical protein
MSPLMASVPPLQAPLSDAPMRCRAAASYSRFAWARASSQRRRRVQQALHGHRGRTNDPLYRARRTLHTGRNLLTDKQTARLETLFAVQEHVEVEATWGSISGSSAATATPTRPASANCCEP